MCFWFLGLVLKEIESLPGKQKESALPEYLANGDVLKTRSIQTKNNSEHTQTQGPAGAPTSWPQTVTHLMLRERRFASFHFKTPRKTDKNTRTYCFHNKLLKEVLDYIFQILAQDMGHVLEHKKFPHQVKRKKV